MTYRFILYLTLFVVLIISPLTAQDSIFINEILASNTFSHLDPVSKNFIDCIELYNNSDFEVDLNGMYLTDKLDNPRKWQFTHPTILPAKGYLVIYATGNENGRTANFKLSKSGESLGLYSNSGKLIDSVTFPKQVTDHSYGRYPDGDASFYYFAEPSIGSTNKSDTTRQHTQLNPPWFSGGFGLWNQISSLSMLAQENETIHYTLDGSIPTSASEIYTEPIPVYKTTVVSARTFRPGYLPSKTTVTTCSNIDLTFDLPVISIATNPEYLFSDSIGITTGITVNDSIGADPPFDPDANFWRDWERPIHFTYFTEDGLLGFGCNAGIQVFGGAFGRQIPQKAFTIFFRDSYGESEISYPLFKSKDIENFSRFIIRASSNDYNRTFLRDAMMTTLVVDRMDIDYQAYQPALGFINGDFWGIYNIREKMNDYYPQSNYGVDKDNLDLLELNGEVAAGRADHYQNMIDYIRNNDISKNEIYNYIKTQMDVNEYNNYMIAQIYFRNHDWPMNNIKYWREQSSNGRWRWLLYDLDWGFGGESREGGAQYKTNTIEWLLEQEETNFLFKNLLKNQTFKNEFIQRFCSHLNTTFAEHRVLHIIDSLSFNLSQYMPMHIERWHVPPSMSKWDGELDTLRVFAEHRPEYIRNHLIETFDLKGMIPVEIHAHPPNSGNIKINSVQLIDNGYWGKMAKELTVTVVAKANPGYIFTGWDGTLVDYSDSLTFVLQDTTVLFAHFTSAQIPHVVINEIHYNPSKSLQGSDEDYEFIELYNAGNANADLSRYYFDRGLTCEFPNNTQLAAGKYIIVANNKRTYQNPNNTVFEFQAGKLANEGEAIVLCDSSGIVVDSVNYSDELPWPVTPDGDGPSLMLIDPFKLNSIANNWKASTQMGGTPGYDNSTTLISSNNTDPKQFQLYQNYPNPFNHETQICFDLAKASHVELIIFNSLGQQVITLAHCKYNAGSINLSWNGHDKYNNTLPSGLYFYKMITNTGFKNLKKMILLK